MSTSKKSKKNTQAQVKREVTGVCLVALGLFFGVSIYSNAVGIVGNAISDFFFGVFGLMCYVLPVLIFTLGIAVIAVAKKKNTASQFVLAIVGVMLIMSVVHTAAFGEAENRTVLQYYKEAFSSGKFDHTGGGIFGALLSYPLLLLLGKVGTFIFLIAGALIIVLVVTKLSLRDTAEKVTQTVKAGVENIADTFEARKQGLYTEDLMNPQPAPEAKQRSKRRRHEAEPAIEATVNDINKVKNAERDIDLLPVNGSIKKKDEPFDIVVPPFSEPVPLIKKEEKISRISNNAPEDEEEAAPPFTEPVIEPPPVVMEPPVYQRPPYTLLNSPEKSRAKTAENPQEKGRLLISTLASFNISARMLNISVGPVITRYELQPAQGVRVNRITALADDLALALAAPRVRIEAPIPGKAAIGIEVPNTNVAPVTLREIVESKEFNDARSPIAFALGKGIAGEIIVPDLDRMPHLLIAGATRSGKSVCINTILLSMVYRSAPKDLRLILVDPKVVELKMYSALPHLLLPVVTDPKRAAGALKWAVMEMEQRYKRMAAVNARDLARYNSVVEDENEKLPKIVVVIDELADLMMVAAKDVEESVCRIAQLGRAAGIHLIVATQRPSTDVITGLIKANMPSRIAFAVSSSVDSRVILDQNGAEKLIGNGDMLFHADGSNKPRRAQGAFVSDEEVERVMAFFEETCPQQPENPDNVMLDDIVLSGGGQAQGNGKQEDDLLPEAAKIVLDSGQASISMIQRRLRVGYARAARLVDIMEQKGIVSGFDGSKPRKLLIGYAEYDQMFGSGQSNE